MSNLKEELKKLIAEPNNQNKLIKIEEFRGKVIKLWLVDHPHQMLDEHVFNGFRYILYRICFDKKSLYNLEYECYGEYFDWFMKKFRK